MARLLFLVILLLVILLLWRQWRRGGGLWGGTKDTPLQKTQQQTTASAPMLKCAVCQSYVAATEIHQESDGKVKCATCKSA